MNAVRNEKLVRAVELLLLMVVLAVYALIALYIGSTGTRSTGKGDKLAAIEELFWLISIGVFLFGWAVRYMFYSRSLIARVTVGMSLVLTLYVTLCSLLPLFV
jgi:cell division protein FtsW (lipid II flippase)